MLKEHWLWKQRGHLYRWLIKRDSRYEKFVVPSCPKSFGDFNYHSRYIDIFCTIFTSQLSNEDSKLVIRFLPIILGSRVIIWYPTTNFWKLIFGRRLSYVKTSLAGLFSEKRKKLKNVLKKRFGSSGKKIKNVLNSLRSLGVGTTPTPRKFWSNANFTSVCLDR